MSRVLLIGNGAREHALAEAIVRSAEKPELFSFMKAHNPGIAALSEEVQLGSYDDIPGIVAFAQSVQPDFAVIGPEDPLGNGVADALEKAGIPCVGPRKELARLETSKSFTRLLIEKHKIHGNPMFKVFQNINGIREFLKTIGPCVIKPDGLTAGKGVKVWGDHFQSSEEAFAYAKEVLVTHPAVVIEEKLDGEEFSLMSFTDGTTVLDCPPVQDQKRAFAGDKGPNCYSSDTEVLTENGWKHFNELNKEEKVMSFDPKSMSLLYKTPKKIYWMKYGGDMVQFKHRELDLLVTPNHRMLVRGRKSRKIEVIEAQNLVGENEVFLTGRWEGKSSRYFEIVAYDYKFNRKLKKQRIKFVDWIRFMGLFLSEGYVVDSKDCHRVYICQTKKSGYLCEFEKILSKLPFGHTYSEKDSKFRINSIQLSRILKKYGEAKQKYIPAYIKNSEDKDIIEFLKAFRMGDGSIHLKNERFHSASRRMIDDLQELIVKIGKSGIITVDKRKRMVNPINRKQYKANPVYSIEIKPAEVVGIRKKDIKKIRYEGYIGCVDISNGFVVVRRNNRVSISGNTGGMGSYSDANHLLPFLKKEHLKEAHEITVRIAEALKKEFGAYKGVMYGGFMLTKNGVKVIEYNARLGDPEAMNVLSILESDFCELCRSIITESLHEYGLRFKKQATVCKYAVPTGYPEKPVKGVKIEIPADIKDVSCYYASVEQKENGLALLGSRAVAFVGTGKTLEEAEKKAEFAVSQVKGPVFHREDIGTKELIQKRIDHMKRIQHG